MRKAIQYTVAGIAAITIAAGIVSAQAAQRNIHPSDSINPLVNMAYCVNEDGSTQEGYQPLCTWAATEQGNGHGDSYVLRNGVIQCIWTEDGSECYTGGHVLLYAWRADGECHDMTHINA